jgi:hypothetical protein
MQLALEGLSLSSNFGITPLGMAIGLVLATTNYAPL